MLVLMALLSACGAAREITRAPQAAYDEATAESAYGYDGGMAVEEEAAMAEMPAAEPAATMPMAGGGGNANDIQADDLDQQQRLIIRNGSITMSVRNTREVKTSIESRVEQMAGEGAFVVSANESGGGSGSSPYIDMTIRVPSARFDEMMNWLTDQAVQGTNPSINVTAEDVTAEYVDVQARVESLEAARDRLLELMENAETTEELLMAEQQLTQREAEIESLKGRMQYLSEASDLSRISISLQPYILSQPVDTGWKPAETIRRAFEALVDGLQNFGDFLIFFIIAVLPWLLVFGVVVFAIVRFVIWRVRVGRRKRAANTPPPTAPSAPE